MSGLDQVSDQLVNQLIDSHGVKSTLDALARLSGYESTPPTITEFIDNDYYLGKLLGAGLFPVWRVALRDIYPNPFYSPYLEVVLTGGIGQGKSTVSLAGFLYDMCKILHRKTPQKDFNLIRSTKIAFALINATMNLTESVLYDQLSTWLSISPYFSGQLKLATGFTMMPKLVDVVVGSRFTHVLGMAVVSAILSEINFQDKLANQAVDNYNVVKSRLQSRFMTGGSYPGRVWLDSSKKDSGSFIETVILKGREADPELKVHDHPIWDVLPPWKIQYSGKRFKVFIGSESRDPMILEHPDQIINIDESHIIDVPVEYEANFRQDINVALRDLAGKSTQATHKFITSSERISEAFVRPNPVSKVIISLDFFDTGDRLLHYLQYDRIKKDYRPRFIHVDLGLVNDKTGIASTRLDGVVRLNRLDPTTGKVVVTEVLVYYTDFLICLEAKAGQEVPIYKVKELIVDLVKRGYPVALVTTDGYQSTNLRQDLTLAGINSDLLSVDRTADAYNELKLSILEGRWNGIKHPILEKEIKELERSAVTGKIDHPYPLGSKDCSDSVAGSVYSCRMNMVKYMANTSLDELNTALEEFNEPSLYEKIRLRSV